MAPRPPGWPAARPWASKRLPGHPYRTFPLLPASSVSIDPCRMPRLATAAGRKGTMAKEICISSTPHETRLAILEDDQLAEIYYERENEYTLAGSIYNGRVTRVLPGMQSAFVDLGLERDAFLYVTDFLELEDPEESDELEKAAAAGGNQPPREVRHGGGQRQEARPEGRTESRPEPRTESRPESRPDRPGRGDQDRGGRDRRPPVAEVPAAETNQPEQARPEIPALTGEEDTAGGEPGEGGAKRWRGPSSPSRWPGHACACRGSRGNRSFRGNLPRAGNRRVGRGSGDPGCGRASRTEAPSAPAPNYAPRPERTPAPFVLPGESLRKYGGGESLTGGPSTRSAARSAAASSEHLQTSHADRISDQVGWLGPAAGRIAVAPPPRRRARAGDFDRHARRAARCVLGCTPCVLARRRAVRRRGRRICSGARS